MYIFEQQALVMMQLQAADEVSKSSAGILGVFARLLLQNSAAFLGVLAQAQQGSAGQLPKLGQPTAQPGEQMLLAVTDLWLDKVDCVASPYPRKLHALAMCLLLSVPSGGMLYRLESIVGHITSVWFEVNAAAAWVFARPCFSGMTHLLLQDEASLMLHIEWCHALLDGCECRWPLHS
jgi:hypothetical protein